MTIVCPDGREGTERCVCSQWLCERYSTRLSDDLSHAKDSAQYNLERVVRVVSVGKPPCWVRGRVTINLALVKLIRQSCRACAADVCRQVLDCRMFIAVATATSCAAR